jgi:hypothetical protein
VDRVLQSSPVAMDLGSDDLPGGVSHSVATRSSES